RHPRPTLFPYTPLFRSRALEQIALPRPAGAARALRLARLDIRELDAGIAAYRAGKSQAFIRDVGVWQSDRRASRAFRALGAPARSEEHTSELQSRGHRV